MKTFKEYVNESEELNETHFSDEEMKMIKKHYKDNSSMQGMLSRYETAEKQSDMKKAGEIAKGIKKIAKDDKVMESSNASNVVAEAKAVSTTQAVNKASKLVGDLDKFEIIVVDMQDRDLIDSRSAKAFDKAVKDMRTAIDMIEVQIF
jgi:Asp-tRNA(Asn)/Glu-tRNA(Gln) amidotransferase A subunit family amidase